MSIARRRAAAKSFVEHHAGIRSAGVIVKTGPVALASNGRAVVTLQLVIDQEDIEKELQARSKAGR